MLLTVQLIWFPVIHSCVNSSKKSCLRGFKACYCFNSYELDSQFLGILSSSMFRTWPSCTFIPANYPIFSISIKMIQNCPILTLSHDLATYNINCPTLSSHYDLVVVIVRSEVGGRINRRKWSCWSAPQYTLVISPVRSWEGTLVVRHLIYGICQCNAELIMVIDFRYVRLMIPSVEPTSVEQLVQKNVRFN